MTSVSGIYAPGSRAALVFGWKRLVFTLMRPTRESTYGTYGWPQ